MLEKRKIPDNIHVYPQPFLTNNPRAKRASICHSTDLNNFSFSLFAGPLSEVQTATGLDVTLPCDLLPTAMSQTDKVQLVIWYKEGNAKPIYS